MDKAKIEELVRLVVIPALKNHDQRDVLTTACNAMSKWFEQQAVTQVPISAKDLYNLADFIRYRYELDYSTDYIQDDLVTWFGEGSLQEPVVVGLSDEQVHEFIDAWHKSTRYDAVGVYKDWAKTQTFAEPYDLESLRIATDLHDRAAEGFKNVVKEITVPVGLSNEQILGFISEWFNSDDIDAIEVYKEWAKSQTFAQPVVGNSDTRFSPDWDDAPKSATSCQVKRVWLDALGIPVEFKVLIDEQRPTPPAPKVEVGQVWKYKNSTYVVTGIERIKGKTKIGTEWVDDLELVHYHRGTNLVSIEFQAYTRTMEDFLTKFEQVQP
jgi:hypothetical protein